MAEENLARNIRRLRRFTGMSQKEFAQKMGITPSALSSYETGKTLPPVSFLIRIVREYHVSYDWLFS